MLLAGNFAICNIGGGTMKCRAKSKTNKLFWSFKRTDKNYTAVQMKMLTQKAHL